MYTYLHIYGLYLCRLIAFLLGEFNSNPQLIAGQSNDPTSHGARCMNDNGNVVVPLDSLIATISIYFDHLVNEWTRQNEKPDVDDAVAKGGYQLFVCLYVYMNK